MNDDGIVMLMPALGACPGLPACDPPASFCGDHQDVYRAMHKAIVAERKKDRELLAEARGWLLNYGGDAPPGQAVLDLVKRIEERM
jgi:hypothetical protein